MYLHNDFRGTPSLGEAGWLAACMACDADDENDLMEIDLQETFMFMTCNAWNVIVDLDTYYVIHIHQNKKHTPFIG